MARKTSPARITVNQIDDKAVCAPQSEQPWPNALRLKKAGAAKFGKDFEYRQCEAPDCGRWYGRSWPLGTPEPPRVCDYCNRPKRKVSREQVAAMQAGRKRARGAA